mgnify:CR=1 FL=1
MALAFGRFGTSLVREHPRTALASVKGLEDALRFHGRIDRVRVWVAHYAADSLESDSDIVSFLTG